MSQPVSNGGIWGEVTACVPRPRRRILLGAILLTALLHGVVFGVTYWVELSLESWSASVAAHVHQELARDNQVDLELPVTPPATPPPQPPVAKAETPPPQEDEVPSEAEPKPARAEAPKAAPAEAAKTLVASPGPQGDDPADFSLAQGGGDVYAGGVTTADGTSKTAVRTMDVDPRAKPLAPPAPPAKKRVEAVPPPPPPKPAVEPPPTGPDLSRPVGLVNPDWTCPWPKEADDEQIDAQAVLLRLAVDANGQVEAARVVKEPGHGFGPAAVACAQRTRFVAARDRSGRPIRTDGALVRVQFSR